MAFCIDLLVFFHCIKPCELILYIYVCSVVIIKYSLALILMYNSTFSIQGSLVISCDDSLLVQELSFSNVWLGYVVG